jgi:uncharacterized protein YfiM (DUF2279 family)
MTLDHLGRRLRAIRAAAAAHAKHPDLARRAGRKGGLRTSRNFAGGASAWGRAMAAASHSRSHFHYASTEDQTSGPGRAEDTSRAPPTS